MRILIAEDDIVSRRMLEATLVKWRYEVVVTNNGAEAWQILQSENPPKLVILDWMMPEMDGLEVCKKVRENAELDSTYIILLTARGQKEDIVSGLDAGANDYITKPFDRNELKARIQVGVRMINLQNELEEHIKKLEEAMSEVRQLQGFLPICAYCKKIRTDDDYWEQVEKYISKRSNIQFSHGICPECYTKIMKEELQKDK